MNTLISKKHSAFPSTHPLFKLGHQSRQQYLLRRKAPRGSKMVCPFLHCQVTTTGNRQGHQEFNLPAEAFPPSQCLLTCFSSRESDLHSLRCVRSHPTERGGHHSRPLPEAPEGSGQAPAGQAGEGRAGPLTWGSLRAAEPSWIRGMRFRHRGAASAQRNGAAGPARKGRARGSRQHRRRRHRPREPLGGDSRGQPARDSRGEPAQDTVGSPGHRGQPGIAADSPGQPRTLRAPSAPATFRILPRPTLSARRGTRVSSRESSATVPLARPFRRAAALRAGWGKGGAGTYGGHGDGFKTYRTEPGQRVVFKPHRVIVS